MATRAQIAYMDEEGMEIVSTYNHYDGYPDSLGKALLDHYDNDSKAEEIASRGYVSFVDPETGEIEANNTGTPDTFKSSGDLDVLLRMWYDHCNGSGADYVYLYGGQGMGNWIDSKMYDMGQDQFVNYFKEELGFGMDDYDEYDENNIDMMEEGYEKKWEKFLNESKLNVVAMALDALKDEPNLQVYLDSLENDIRLNGSEEYETYTPDDWEEDFENYMADKMDY